MAYTALYRKFRPLRFEDMVGQEHITRTIRNQIIAGRVGHAYLLNGGRGTGKTTTAKILARAVNCLNPQDGEPCNECEICKAALAGSLTDIVEMDAASNNSVDDIRAIRDEVNFLPTLAKYRVYIIDEVHMLSTGAFNALLKTLEEPPSHVKFILATTEPQKLPATILSRCQRFDFKKISNEDISKRLQYVCDESKIEITKEALKIIAVLAEGAMRDALSILERCLQEGNEKIDEDLVKDLVGIPKLTFVSRIMQAIIEYHVEDVLKTVEEVNNEGKDLQNLLWELIKYAKDILVFKTCGKLEIYNEEELKQIDALSKQISKERLLQIIYTLSQLENDMKWSSQKTVLFEVAMIKLCHSEESSKGTGLEDIVQRLNMLEDKINSGKIAVKIDSSSEQIQNGTSQNAENSKKQVKINPNIGKVGIEQVNNVQVEKLPFWPKVIEELKEIGVDDQAIERILTFIEIDGRADFYYLNPGKYAARLINDRNGNGEWDTGDYAKGIQPEEVYYFPKVVEYKALWDVDQNWDIHATPVDKQKLDELKKQKPDEDKKKKERERDRNNQNRNRR